MGNIEKYVLITNLQFVSIGIVRTHCNALLLEEWDADMLSNMPNGGLRQRIRGFGTEPTWPVFDMASPTIEYTLEAAASSNIMIASQDGGLRPLLFGNVMQIKGFNGPRLDLVLSDNSKPLDVETFEGDIAKVWDVLPEKVSRYWHAPYMPRLSWGRPLGTAL
jgi:hypothetical protein